MKKKGRNMYILPISTTTFGAKPTLSATATKALTEKAAEAIKVTELTLPGRNLGETVPIKVIGEIGEKIKDRTNITSVEYKVGQREVSHTNKQGFTYNRFDKIIDEIEKNIQDGMDFLYEFLKAQKKFKI